MATSGRPGVSEPIGPGEALERRERARRSFILYALMIVGGVTGLGLSVGPEHGAGILTGAIAPWLALSLAALWLVSIIWGSIVYARHIDEIDRAAQIWGIATAGSTVLILYPAWYILWRGRLLPEPNAHIIFATLYVVMILAYLWKKFR